MLLCASLLLICLVIAGCGSTQGEAEREERPKQPNFVFIMTDDMSRDLTQYMPRLEKLVAEEGTTFENAFVTNSICCPSRATLLRGQYTHNHQVLGNAPPRGGYPKFHELGREESTIATWLKTEGYRTAYFGKYLNRYNTNAVPPGWDEWHAVAGNYISDRYNHNGLIRAYDTERYPEADMLADMSTKYVKRVSEKEPPFFMVVAPRAPHEPAIPAPRHEEDLPGVELPRPPSFDEEDVSDKPLWIRDNPPLSKERLSLLQDLYENRARSMLAVDEMIERIVTTLRETGELRDTYVIFTSDNGYHMGHHRLPEGKWTAYEEDIRVPLMVRGPLVPKGRTLDHLVLNNDLAPTLARLTGAPVPGFVDGHSFAPLLRKKPPKPAEWRSAFLIEAESRPVPARPRIRAVRTERYVYIELGSGERELYDLKEDPYEQDNIYESASPKMIERLEERLNRLRYCIGEECSSAEGF
jgi:N-acetylglucosamine-6-sulfatase